MHAPADAAGRADRLRPCAVRADSDSIVPPPCSPHSDHPPAEPAAAAPTTRWRPPTRCRAPTAAPRGVRMRRAVSADTCAPGSSWRSPSPRR